MILLILGKTCTGKSYVNNYIKCYLKKENIKFEVFEASEIHRKNNLTMSFLVNNKGILSDIIFNSLNSSENHILISGFRSIEEIDYIKSRYKDVVFVVMKTISIIRISRYISRFKKEKSMLSIIVSYIIKNITDIQLGINKMLKIVNNYNSCLLVKNNLDKDVLNRVINNSILPILLK